jgi:hypothetical protein
VAEACPSCIGSSPKIANLGLIGAFMGVPFVVVLVVLRALRETDDRDP